MTFSFTERRPWEAGFADVFAREIVPRLAPLEAERAAIAAKRRTRFIIVWTIAAVLAAGLVYATRETGLLVFGGALIFVFVLVSSILLAIKSQGNWEARLKEEIMPPITSFLGVTYEPVPTRRPPMAKLAELGVVASFNQEAYTDAIAGTHRGISYYAVEANLAQRRRVTRDGKTSTETTTVFSGVVATFSTRRPAPCAIAIDRDSGKVLNKLSAWAKMAPRALTRVEIDDAEFERNFEVFAENPAAAKAFLTGPFLKSLVELVVDDETEMPRGIRGAFVGDEFHLVVSGGNEQLVVFGGVGESLAKIEERLHRMLYDMTFPRRVVDKLLGPQPAAAPASASPAD